MFLKLELRSDVLSDELRYKDFSDHSRKAQCFWESVKSNCGRSASLDPLTSKGNAEKYPPGHLGSGLTVKPRRGGITQECERGGGEMLIF